MKRYLLLLAAASACLAANAQNIEFADPGCKAICVKYFDTDADGEISEEEAAAVTDIRKCFFRSKISSFDEFRYFTGVKKVSNMAFRNSSLESIVLPEGLASIGKGAFQECVSLTSVVLPEGLESVDDLAFSGCTALAEINLPSSVRMIGYQAFAGCTSLESLVIPRKINLLGDDAFFSSGLKELRFLCKEAPSCPSLILPSSVEAVYIPKGTLSSWKSEEGWEKYAEKLISE